MEEFSFQVTVFFFSLFLNEASVQVAEKVVNTVFTISGTLSVAIQSQECNSAHLHTYIPDIHHTSKYIFCDMLLIRWALYCRHQEDRVG